MNHLRDHECLLKAKHLYIYILLTILGSESNKIRNLTVLYAAPVAGVVFVDV